MVLATLLAVEHRDGHAPDTLTGNAPVAAVADHAGHTVMAPGGLPLHAVDGFVNILLEGVNGAEPLLSGAEDDGMMAAPAMRILVGDVLHAHQMAGLFDMLQNHLVGRPHLETGKLARLLGEIAAVVHRHHDGQLGIVIDADLKVLNAVTWRGMDTAGAVLQRDMVTQNHQTGAVQEGMLIFQQFQLAAQHHIGQNLVLLNMTGVHGGLDQSSRHDVHLVTDLDKGVFHGGVQTGGHVGGQRPRSGGPDHDPGLVQLDAMSGQNALGVSRQLIAHIDGIALILGVLDFRLGQRGTILGAPVNSLHALVDITFFGHFTENLHLPRLKLGAQRQVGILKIALHTKTLELGVHHVNMLGGKLPAQAAQLQLGYAGFLVSQRPQRFQFDGQTMGVITGHVGSLKTRHVLVADDDILDDLVQRGAHMNGTVGIRRAVMQNKLRIARIVFDHLLVDTVGFPILQHLRLFFRQTGPHFKGGLHFMNGVVIILGQDFQLSSIIFGQLSCHNLNL